MAAEETQGSGAVVGAEGVRTNGGGKSVVGEGWDGWGEGPTLGNWGDPRWREGEGWREFFGVSSVGAAPEAGLGLPPLPWRLSDV